MKYFQTHHSAEREYIYPILIVKVNMLFDKKLNIIPTIYPIQLEKYMPKLKNISKNITNAVMPVFEIPTTIYLSS